MILGIDYCCEIDSLLTMICFFIYKQWLLMSLENKSRSTFIDWDYFKCEFKMRLDIYKMCSRFSEAELNQIELYMNNLN